MFSNDPSLVHEVDIKPGISDHKRVVIKLSVKPIINKPASKISYAFNESNMYDLKTAFSQAEWPSDNEDIENKLHKRLKQHCTLEKKKKYNNHRKKVNTILYKAEQIYVNKICW